MAEITTGFDDKTLLVKLTPEDHVMIGTTPQESPVNELPESAATPPQEAPEVTLLEYGDYQCPHCGMAAQVVKQLQRHFGEALLYAWRHFPLTEIHPMAEAAAEAAEWAGANGRFWGMHDLLLTNQEDLSLDLISSLGDEIGSDAQALSEALEQKAFAESVAADVEGGVEAGVHGTPTFFVNGVKHEGGWDFDTLRAAIEKALRLTGRRAA